MHGVWQRSCSWGRHNQVSRGERELRGERRGRSGRSLSATAAPLFFVLLAQAPLAGQAIRPLVRVGAAGSTVLVEDAVATPGLRERFGAVDANVEGRAAPGPLVEAGLEVQLRPRVRLSAVASWQASSLQAEDGAGTRRVQDLSLLAGLLEVGFGIRGPLEVSAGAGALSYRSEEFGIFDEGSDLVPLARVGAGGTLSWRGHVVRLGGFAEGHTFGTPAIRRLGGENGMVMRYGVQAGLVWGGAR